MRVLGFVVAVYLLATGVALLLWPQRLLEAARRSRHRPARPAERAPGWRRSRQPDAAGRPEAVIAMRAVGVIALGLSVVAFALLR